MPDSGRPGATGVDPELAPGPATRPRAALVVGIGGMVGALARVGVAEALPHATGTWAWSTLLTNVTGCAVLAALVVVLAARFPADRYLRLALGTGVLGGYTTFSAFSLDAVELLRDGRAGMAVVYAVASLLSVLGATVAGLLLGRAAVPRVVR